MLADLVSHGTRLGRLLRWPLRWIPREVPRRIRSGPGSGLLWHPGSGPHGIWLGLYERRLLTAFAESVGPGAVVWDVGAHTGLYSLLAAHRGARVVAFEPLAVNARWLERNLAVNGLAHRVRLQPFALGFREGLAPFRVERTGMEGRLLSSPDRGEGSPEAVPVRRADGLEGLPPPAILKIDVEGGELDVLRGAARVVAENRPTTFLEVHDRVTIQDCLALLPGYGAVEVERRRYLCRPPPV